MSSLSSTLSATLAQLRANLDRGRLDASIFQGMFNKMTFLSTTLAELRAKLDKGRDASTRQLLRAARVFGQALDEECQACLADLDGLPEYRNGLQEFNRVGAAIAPPIEQLPPAAAAAAVALPHINVVPDEFKDKGHEDKGQVHKIKQEEGQESASAADVDLVAMASAKPGTSRKRKAPPPLTSSRSKKKQRERSSKRRKTGHAPPPAPVDA
jgi:hypothetical protein